MIESGVSRLSQEVASTPGLRIRQGTVVSWSSYSITVTIGGSTEQVTGVKYLGSYAPRVGAHVWLITDGADVFAIGHLAPRGVPALEVSNTALQTTTTGTELTLTFDTEVGTDPWGMRAGAQPTRLVAPISGWYTATGNFDMVGNATGFRWARVRKNGTTVMASSRVLTTGAGQPTDLNVTTGAISLAANDYLTLTAQQNSGGNLDVNPGAIFRMHYIGPAE